MKLLRGVDKVPAFAGGTVATIGNFDGVHLGHQALLAHLKKEADRLQLPLVVLLFEPQPGEFFRGDCAPARLSTLREKLEILKRCQVDYVYCLPFNKILSMMSAEEFASHWFFSLLKTQYLLIGTDFRFGQNRTGDITLLRKMTANTSIKVEEFPDFVLDSTRISSTKIREFLASNRLDETAKLLGRPYSMCGRVVKGDGRGRQWGIPTANLLVQRLSLPLKGVFCVSMKLASGTLINGVANIGCRPTVDGTKNVLEIHLLNFNGNLYGEMVQVFFLKQLRGEIKFPSIEALIAQIKHDISMAKAHFSDSHLTFNAIAK